MHLNKFRYHFAPTEDGSSGGGGEPETPVQKTEDTQSSSDDGVDHKARANEFRGKLRSQTKELNDMRAELGNLRKQYEGIDLDLVAKMQEQIEAAKADEEKALLAKGELDEVVKRRTAAAILRKEQDMEALSAAKQASDESARKAQDALNGFLLERDLLAEVEKQGLRLKPGARAAALLTARQDWRVNEEGKHEAYRDGNPIYGEDATAIQMSEYVKEHLFRQNSFLFEEGKGGNSDGNTRTSNTNHDGKILIPKGDAAMRARYTKELATGKAVIVD